MPGENYPLVPGPKSGEGAGLWFLKIISGVLVFVILVVHFIVNHFLGSVAGLLTYQEIVRYYASNPIIPMMEAMFVLIVVPHALLGMRGILLDLQPTPKVLKNVDYGMTLLGVISIGYGLWLILVVVQQGLS